MIDPAHVAREHIDRLVPRYLLYLQDARPGLGRARDESRAQAMPAERRRVETGGQGVAASPPAPRLPRASPAASPCPRVATPGRAAPPLCRRPVATPGRGQCRCSPAPRYHQHRTALLTRGQSRQRSDSAHDANRRLRPRGRKGKGPVQWGCRGQLSQRGSLPRKPH